MINGNKKGETQLKYQAAKDQTQAPQNQEWVMPPWLEDALNYIYKELNWLDLAFFALGAMALTILLLILLKRRRSLEGEIVLRYEEEIEEVKKGHLEEISKAEKSIQAFRSQLEEIEYAFQKDLKKQEKVYKESLEEVEAGHRKKVQKLEKGHGEIHSTDEYSIFELKQEINHLRTKQIKEVQAFQDEIKHLKSEIEKMHEGHTKEIEKAEMRISDLKKQMQALMYRV